MVWPGQLSNTSLLWALHDKSRSDPSKSSGWRVSRYRYFVYVMVGSFAWYWIPGVLWQGLSVFAFITCQCICENTTVTVTSDKYCRD
jgi:hypothetical protein